VRGSRYVGNDNLVENKSIFRPFERPPPPPSPECRMGRQRRKFYPISAKFHPAHPLKTQPTREGGGSRGRGAGWTRNAPHVHLSARVPTLLRLHSSRLPRRITSLAAALRSSAASRRFGARVHVNAGHTFTPTARGAYKTLLCGAIAAHPPSPRPPPLTSPSP
jgi:hypothetical protein